MEFVESQSRASQLSRLTRLTVVLTSERSNWVSVSSPLANQLHNLNKLPVILQVRLLDGAGLPSKQPGHVHHVAWTGGVLDPGKAAAAGRGGLGLGVPSALAAALGLRAGTAVQVTPLPHGVPDAAVVEVEPMGESDWEVVEKNAGFLEDQMLGQVSVLARGQLFTVWARGGAAVRLRATSTQPADLVRLVAGCEIRVAPKPRGLPGVAQDGSTQQQQTVLPGHQRQSQGQGQGRQGTVVPLGPGSWSSGSQHSAVGPRGRGVNGAAAANGHAAARGGMSWQEGWQQQQLNYLPQQHQLQPNQGQQQDRLADGLLAKKLLANGAGAGIGGATAAGAANGQPTAAASNGVTGRPQSPFAACAAQSPFSSGSISLGVPSPLPGAGAGGAAGLGGLPSTAAVPPAGSGAAALAGIALQARPTWASSLAGPGSLSKQLSCESPSSASVAAAAAALSGAGLGGGAMTGGVGGPGADREPGGDATANGCVEATGGCGHGDAGATAVVVARGNGDGDGDMKPAVASKPAGYVGAARLPPPGPGDPHPTAHEHLPPLQPPPSDSTAGDQAQEARPLAAPGPAAQRGLPPRAQQLEPQDRLQLQERTDLRQPSRHQQDHDPNQHQLQPQQPHLQPAPRPQRHHPPQALRLRVLDLPPSKYLVPLESISQPPAQPEAAPVSNSSTPPATSTAAAQPAPALPAVQVWLTLAVAVAPATAAALLGDAGASAAASLGYGSGNTAVVRLHGRGTIRDLLGVLVPEPCCPPGHVMLAPPLQHVLSVLPHMHVTVAALPLPPAAAAAADAATPLPLLTLKLHPLPTPAPRYNIAPRNGSITATAATVPLAAQTPGSAADMQDFEASLLTAAAAAAPAAKALAPAAASQLQATSHAVWAWLAAQMEGIRQAVLACRCDGERPCTAGEGEPAEGTSTADEEGPEVMLPLASGAVMHFRISGDQQIRNGINGGGGDGGSGGVGSIATAVGSLPPAGPGDYCMILHAVRRTHTATPGAAGPQPSAPPLVSSRALAAMLAAADPQHQPTATATPAAAATSVLSVGDKLGNPVVLPDVSYESARHAASLAARSLPPPLQPPPAPGTAAAAASVAIKLPHNVALSSNVSVAVTSTQGTTTAAAAGVSSGLDLSHISWLSEHLERCLRRLLPQLDPWVSSAVARAGLPRCGGVLLTGPQGSGRSQLLAALGDLAERHPALQAHVVHVRCGQLAGGSHSATTSALASVAAEALHCSPCLLLLDDLDLMCPSAAEGSDYGMQHPEGAAAAARLADWLSSLLDELSAAPAAALLEPEAAAAAAGSGPCGSPTTAGTAGVVAVDGCSAAGALHVPAIAVVASARDAAGVHASLRRVGRLDFEVRLPTPGSKGRAAMLAAAARQRGVAVDPGQLAAVAGAAEGFEGVDLRLLLDRAVHNALRRQLSRQQLPQLPPPPPPQQQQQRLQPSPDVVAAAAPGATAAPDGAKGAAGGAVPPHLLPLSLVPSLSVTEGDLREALEGFVPAAFWGVQQAGAAGGKAEGWEDVGGLHHVVASLREALLLPVRYRDLVAAAPLRLRTGALLYGPPGCGKTHVVGAAVAAVAKVAPLRFLSVKGPELLNKYIGASEAAVRDLFARAAAAAPAVLFFDEFDAIAPPRGHDSTGVTDRVVNQLLTELDGVEGLRGVVVLAATSRPDLVDAALLRPGRLDRLLFCGPPEGPEQRLEILQALSRRLRLAPDVDLRQVAQASPGMTGADLGAVLSEAQLHAINESVEAASASSARGHKLSDTADSTSSGTTSAGGSGSGTGGHSGSAADSEAAAGPPPGPEGGTPGAGISQPRPDTGPGLAAGGSGAAGPMICMRHLDRAVAVARPSLPAAEAARLAALYSRFQQDREAPGARQQQQLVEGDVGPGKRATLA